MAIPVDASSLSHITELASNPARFPRNPAESRREPLVLYLARVPGKRDVILSTLKPRLKNVTAEDINSSLYYLHLDVPEDTAFVAKYRTEETYEERSSTDTISRKPVAFQINAGQQPNLEDQYQGKSSIDSIARKPVAQKIYTGPHPGYLPTDFRQSPYSPETSKQVERRPGGFSEDSGNLRSNPGNISPSTNSEGLIKRRPLGPRPPQSHANLSRKPLPSLPGVENLQSPNKSPTHSFEASMGRNNAPSKTTFSITLIRRDPSSNAQWNIGRISSKPLFDNNNLPERASETPYSPIYVYIDNPGYTKFHSDSQTRIPPAVYSGFCRQVQMTWEPRNARRSFDKQKPSGNSRSAESLTQDAASLGRAKGYVFESPWNGQCSFITSAGGRSLKCRHTLSGNGMKIDNTRDSTTNVSAEVSELRFNLPKSAASSHKTSSSVDIGRLAISKFSHIKNKLSSESSKSSPASPRTPTFNPYPPALTSDEDENDDDDGLDQLGQEKAGGGVRGKRVKLAKLIIQHEGQQMLDLVVAANMGIFWRIWNR